MLDPFTAGRKYARLGVSYITAGCEYISRNPVFSVCPLAERLFNDGFYAARAIPKWAVL